MGFVLSLVFGVRLLVKASAVGARLGSSPLNVQIRRRVDGTAGLWYRVVLGLHLFSSLGPCVRFRLGSTGERVVLIAKGVVQAADAHLHPLVRRIFGTLRRGLARNDRQVARLNLWGSSEVALILFQGSGVNIVAGLIRGRRCWADQIVDGTPPYHRRKGLLIRSSGVGRRRHTARIFHGLTTGMEMPRNAVPWLDGHSGFRFHDLHVAEHQIRIGQTQDFVDIRSRLVDRLSVVVKHQAAVRAVKIFDYGITWSVDLRGWDMIGCSLLTLLLVSSHRSYLTTFLVFLLALIQRKWICK